MADEHRDHCLCIHRVVDMKDQVESLQRQLSERDEQLREAREEIERLRATQSTEWISCNVKNPEPLTSAVQRCILRVKHLGPHIYQ